MGGGEGDGFGVLAPKVGRFIEGLTLSGGDLDGQPFVVLPWERRFLRGAFAGGVQTAGLSVARGNGKSALVAAIASAVVDPEGPLHGPRREVVCVGPSFEQSRIIFEDVLAFLEDRYDLDNRRRWRKANTANRALLEWRKTGCRVRCIGSDPSTAHGLRPFLVLADEPAQYDAAKRDRMLAAIRTGLGKVPGSRMVALGTRPATDGHWFARMLAGGADYAQVHAARPDDPPFRRRTWKRANPSLDALPSLEEAIRAEATDAKRDETALQSFLALRLNMGVADAAASVLLAAESWKRAEALPVPEKRSPDYVLGVDLGTNAAMSATAAYFRSGELEAVACFPEVPSLSERGLGDGVGDLYTRMARRGELFQAGRRVSDVPALLREVLDRWGRPVAIVADRWREAELRQALEAVGFPIADLVSRGQGYRDGGQDVRDFRAAVLGDKVRPSRSLLLRAALSEARVTCDPAGNAKLSKGAQGGRRLRSRDDAAAAAVLAVSAGFRRWHGGTTKRPRWRYAGVA